MAFRSTWSPNFDCLVRAGDQGIALGNNSLAAWVRFDNFSAAYEVIEINGNGYSFGSAIFLNGSDFEYSQRSSSAQINKLGGLSLSANTWYHVALTYDGTTMRCYFNGAEIQTSTGLTGTRGNWYDLQVGPALGYIQDAFFYTRALTALEVQQLYARRITPSSLNCRHWLPCFPGADRLKDRSGNGLDFSNNGTPADPGSTIPLPPAGWGGTRSRLILPGASSLTFSGSVTSPTAATGTLLKKPTFSGAAASPSGASGTLAVRKIFTGAVATSPSASQGAAQSRIVFGGVMTSPTAMQGTGQSRIVFGGDVATPTACTGGLTILGITSFSGVATTPTECTAVMNVRKTTGGIVTSPSAATGGMQVRKSSAASATSPTACSGGLNVYKYFDGVIASPTACQGFQSGGTIISPIGPEDPRTTQKRRSAALGLYRRPGRH